MITGLNINLTVGSWTVQRLPFAELCLERGAVAGRLALELPDPQGELSRALRNNDPVGLFFGYRGDQGPASASASSTGTGPAGYGSGPAARWRGKITEIKGAGKTVKITALSPEKALIDTRVTECFHKESGRQVARRLITLAGLAPGRLEGPDETIPHLVFSGQAVCDCLRQVNATLERVYEHDMAAQVYWQGQDGRVNWGDFDEPGPRAVFATGDNLISHDPLGVDEGRVTGFLFPGLLHSQQIIIRDAKRGLEITKRALTVRHQLGAKGNLTIVSYGKEKGYA